MCWISVQSHINGLAHFRYTAEDPKWKAENWRAWPHVNLSMDLGPDGLCGSNAMMFHWLLNLTRYSFFQAVPQESFVLLRY